LAFNTASERGNNFWMSRSRFSVNNADGSGAAFMPVQSKACAVEN
jgi:hypothetical protein